MYEYRISLSTLRQNFGKRVEFYEFRFSNSGYGPYCTFYEIDCFTETFNRRECKNMPNFKIIGPERIWLNRYDKLVPEMIKRVKEIQQKLGVELFFAEKSVRLEDVYNDPVNAKRIALIFPQPQARSRALQSYIQSAHELYVLMLVAEALNGKTVYHVHKKPTWWIAHAQEYPTAVVELDNRKFTVWYQFAIKEWIEVVFNGLVRSYLDFNELKKLAKKGRLDDIEKVLGIRPKDVQDALSLVESLERLVKGRQYVKPDIVIFEGDYRSREDLVNGTSDNIILIDAKISITGSDLKQLKGYREVFEREFSRGKMHYVVASLEKAKQLEKLGFTVVEDVIPGRSGELKFVEAIREIISSF